MTDAVLLVDRETAAVPLGRLLEGEGYRVTQVGSGGEALAIVDEEPIDIVILAMSLPDLDGVEVCMALRARGYGGGVILVAPESGEVACVVGLDSGADDYLHQPCGPAELLARLRAVLRRTETETAAKMQRPDGLRVDVAARRVFTGSAEVALTNKEFEVFALLEEHRNKVVPRQRLLTEVWDENWYGSSKTIDVTIARLRGKLTKAGVPDQIVAVRGVGFRLEYPEQVSSGMHSP